jgi:8-oxo-dGTP pyrophosphatase MutT (NUDIX family)
VSAHSSALHDLASWSPPTARQAALRDRFVAHLDAHPDALLRSCRPGHLTAGALVLSHDLDAVLLNLHGKARRWFHFGGHCEHDDTSLLATGRREATEESGIAGLSFHPEPVHLDLHTVAFCDPAVPVDHLDVRYAALAPAGADARASDESLAVRWWPVNALPPLEDEMHELIALAAERCRGGGCVSGQSPEPSSRAPIE